MKSKNTHKEQTQSSHNPCEEPIPDTLRTITPEETARAALNGVACHLDRDEVRVLTRIAERIRGGGRVYGRLRPANDPHTLRSKEAREGLENALVYFACAWLEAGAKEVAH
jgi:hypothetical protein